MKFAGDPETQAGHQVTFTPQTFDANMQSHSETQSTSSQDTRQHGVSSKSKGALEDWTEAGGLRERSRIENSVVQRNYRRKIRERDNLGLHNLKYTRNDQQSPEACEVDSSRAPYSVIQSGTGSFPARPRRNFTTQDSHITHPEAATDALKAAITGSQVKAETLPYPQSTFIVTQQVPRVDFTQPACMQLGYKPQNGAGKVCDIDPDHSYSPGSDRDPNLISTFRLDATALQKRDKKHKLRYRRISVACEQCRKRRIRCIISSEDSRDCSNCIRLNKACTFTSKARPVSEHKGKPTFPSTQNIASWIGANVSQTTTELSNLDAPDAYADATTWLPGDTIRGQPSVPIADATSSASFPVQKIDQNQPSLLIEPQTPLTATPYSLTTYPVILSDPHSQTISPAFQEGLYLPECLPAYGTTSFGLDSNYSYANLQPQGQLYQKQVPEIVNTNTISAADPEVSITQHIQQQDTAHNVQMVSRPKLQCWEHGCNGRSFSTFSNLLRHQREKSGQATKATCSDCGTEFTRAAARNLHQENGKCKPQPST
ncbi:uncharacterized protein PpBr36_11373 [Pyricularia pennisetigena]|uniref:uncharacterized protein n=1 Tax=Pyricularia pennisetigena TaxID=1578925 RepID=UPI00114EA702|nr:uncharacterized protein PpBr36_11373 [Pyricularia pennisetigena]TLS20422.1 hypothetical protein PpBr36_11373 [Pyricularia pennisetigena]